MPITQQSARAGLDTIDVSDPQIYQDDTWRPLFAQLREQEPVHYCRDSALGPYWSVTTYDDILKVELDHSTYSSSSELGGIQITDQPKGRETISFIRMDPPGHTAQRRTVAPIVAPTHLANFEPLIRERTERVLDGLPRNETFDWADRVSVELTAMMLATLFDFPMQEHRKLTYWSDVAIANINSPDSPIKSEDERAAKLGEMAFHFKTLWDQRTAVEPKFDLVSMLAHGAATKDMGVRELTGTIGLLIVGGNDTTRNSMTGGVLALHDYPQEAEKLLAKPSLVPSLVSEIIRYQSPVLHMRRTARVDGEIGGKAIRQGDKVVM